MEIHSLNTLPEVKVITNKVFGDDRGKFFVCYNKELFKENGIDVDFVQDNTSFSVAGTLRGLHHQFNKTQGKLVQVLKGMVYDVAVDIRVGSPTFGQHAMVILNEHNAKMLYVPPGFAHGFLAVKDTIFHYKCTDYYDPTGEVSIGYNDPDIDIKWPVENLNLNISNKDLQAITLKDWEQKHEK